MRFCTALITAVGFFAASVFSYRITTSFIPTVCNEQAYKDSLTGVRNKTAYDDFITKIEENVKAGRIKEYAISVFDANGLKAINDTYGHDIGNMLIINSYKMISEVFEKSLVFRINGDEFAAIMKDDDYKNRYELENFLLKNLRLL